MNDFNRLFFAIKKNCPEGAAVSLDEFHEIVKKEGASYPPEKLALYLSVLQDLGIIEHSEPERHIKLTRFGSLQETVLAE